MTILSEFADSCRYASYRNFAPAEPANPGLFLLFGQVMELSCALKLASLATRHQLFRWHWAVLPPAALAVAVRHLGADQAAPSAPKRRLIRLHHHFGDLCQAACIISAVALYRQGDRLKGGATISMVGLNYLRRFGIAPWRIGLAQLALQALSQIVDVSPRLTITLLGASLMYFPDCTLSALEWMWPELSQLECPPAEAFLPVKPTTGNISTFNTQLNELEQDDFLNGLAAVLFEKNVWVQYYDNGLDAEAFCKQGLTAVLKEAEKNDILNGWLKVIAQHEVTDEALITIAAAGHFPASGGKWIHTIYSKLTNDVVLDNQLEASRVALKALNASYEEDFKKMPILAKPFIQFTNLLFAPSVAPSPRLNGKGSKVHPIRAAFVRLFFMDFCELRAKALESADGDGE